jgi:hypothetical protein
MLSLLPGLKHQSSGLCGDLPFTREDLHVIQMYMGETTLEKIASFAKNALSQ